MVGRWAVVAGSGSRWDDIVSGLPVGERLAASGRRPAMGLFVIDTDIALTTFSGDLDTGLRAWRPRGLS